MSAAECEVWNRELSFAYSVEQHDATAFADHIHAGAVFSAGTAEPARGRDAIVEAWQSILVGKDIILRWHPGYVSIGADPKIALLAGPAWIEHTNPAAKHRYTISNFTSTWVRDTDGQWRVLFDGSGGGSTPATADEVAALAAAQPTTCPGGSVAMASTQPTLPSQR
ncbi:MAG: nuclear transport factor 2 family protein [Lysobacteraceae bacterium]